ncbi:hypothetical protein B0F90DRAFT_1375402 [Multifurca ochricompacta]|uniref:G-protein coupled receptors family 1 profile domain-containing protein n=1 Tax=Multifurca ochricompacta TaxID=376703 RepID=A0AAD4QM28_9AGAM|nr:hypothetical protein B0F90DRAFT_1375402 [Multifurca ochricompacta]
MNIKWANDASVHAGAFCSAQGIIKQLSDVGAALSTLIISLYTVRTLCFPETCPFVGQTHEGEGGRKKSLLWSIIVVACLWTTLGLLVTINIAVNGLHRFYGPTEYWCWIRAEYSVQRTATDFVFLWITAAFSTTIYAMIFLYFRGYIITNGWRVRFSRKRERINVLGPLKQACGLLFYPLVYMANILPLSVVRYSTFAHQHVPFGVVIFVDIIYLSSGFLNVALFAVTRPFLLPHDPPKPEGVSEIPHGNGIIVASHHESSSAHEHSTYGFQHSESPVSDYWPQPILLGEGG